MSRLLDRYKHNIQKLLVNKAFIKAVVQIRITHAIPVSGFSDNDNYRKWFKSVANETRFKQDICKLLKQFDLPSYYYATVKDLVILNATQRLPLPIVLELDQNRDTHEPEIILRIFGDTTSKDILKFWGEVKKIQNGKTQNVLFKPLVRDKPMAGYRLRQSKIHKNFERDEQLRRWREDERLTFKKIYQRAKQAEYRIAETEIPKIITRHKKYIGELGK